MEQQFINNNSKTIAIDFDGTIVEHQLIFKRRKLPSKGKYTFMIEQGVTQKVLEDILDISFNVTKAED